jgi:hypothetical protein
MVTKQMKTVAMPIVNPVVMSSLPDGMAGICGKQFSIFSKSILDKYTKILNYQFDYTALVFLDQMAGVREGQVNQNHTIVVTWKLLSFLLNSETRRNHILYNNPVLMKQITRQIENNLLEIKSNNYEQYKDMERCYEVYKEGNNREFVSTVELSKVSRFMKEADYVETQIKLYEEKQQVAEQEKKQREVIKPFFAPFVMSKSFFSNLNHLVIENKIADYRQIWKQSNTSQLENHYLHLHMKKFEEESDYLKKEEILLNVFREFGGSRVQNYLEKAEETLYRQVINVMYTLAVSDHEMPKKTEIKHETSVRKEPEKSEQSARREMVFEKYQKTEEAIEEVLKSSEEVTRNLLVGKVDEYISLFYEHIRLSEKEREDKEEKYSVLLPRENTDKAAEDNQEIFSDEELKLLLEAADANRETEETKFLEKKLRLFAVKEITERFLEEDVKFLQKDSLEKIHQIFSESSVISETSEANEKKEDVEEKKEKEKRENLAYLNNLNFLNYAKYRETENEIGEVLKGSEEVTRNLLLGKVDEYITLFYEYIRTPEEEQIEQRKDKGENQSTLSSYENTDKAAEDNQEIFSDEELKILLESANTNTETEETKFLERKLRLIAMKEITERFLEEDVEFLEKDRLEQIHQILGNVSFAAYNFENYDFAKYNSSDYNFEDYNFTDKKISLLQDGFEEKNAEKKDTENVAGLIVGKNLWDIQNIQDIKTIFEMGGLPERKLLYLSLEHVIDQTIIKMTTDTENHADTENRTSIEQHTNTENYREEERKKILKDFIGIKKQFVHETDLEKRMTGDWRFLMTKLRSEEILRILSDLEQEDRTLLEKSVKEYVREFYDYVYSVNGGERAERVERIDGEKESVKGTLKETVKESVKETLKETVKEGEKEFSSELGEMERQLWESWNVSFRKEELRQLSGRVEEQTKAVEVAKEVVKKVLESDVENKQDIQNRQNIQSIETIFETGGLPERKLLYLSFEHAIDRTISELTRNIEEYERTESYAVTEGHATAESNIATKNYEGIENHTSIENHADVENNKRYQVAEQKKLLKDFIGIKKQFVHETDLEKRMTGDWQFLMAKPRSEEILHILSDLKQEDRTLLEKSVKEYVREFYDYVYSVNGGERVEGEKESVKEVAKTVRESDVENRQDIQNIETIFETGGLPERKFLYLSFEHAINRTITELTKNIEEHERTEGHTTVESNIATKNYEGIENYTSIEHHADVENNKKYQVAEQKKLLKNFIRIKKQFVHETDLEKRRTGDWQFLMTKPRSEEILRILSNLKQEDRTLLEESVKEYVREFYDYTDSVNRGERGEGEKLLEYLIIKLRSDKIRQNEHKKLKLQQGYGKIIHMTEATMGTYNGSAQFYEILLTQKNKDFRQPPTERTSSVDRKVSSQTRNFENLKYHEESVKMILNHTKDNEQRTERETNNLKSVEQEKILQQLEGELLDYKVELEDKAERLEIVEKQLENQKKNIQFLKEMQGNTKKNMKPSEAKQFMNHLKEELKMERIRNGKM